MTRSEKASSVLAIALSLLFTAAWVDTPLIHDEVGYWSAAGDIAMNGPFSKFENSKLRTYGYPLILSPVRVAEYLLRGIPKRIFLLAFQLPLYFFASLYFRQIVKKTFGERWGTTCYCALCLNFFVLPFTCFALTEILSISVTLLLIASLLELQSSDIRCTYRRHLFKSAFLASCAIMVRPANIYLLPLLVLIGSLCLRKLQFKSRIFGVAVIVLGLAVPMSIQLRNNIVYYNARTPLVAFSLGHLQLKLGKELLKFATHVGRPDAHIKYKNPFYDATRDSAAESPLSWYLAHPLEGGATVSIKIFNLLDQHMIFAYNDKLDHPYRWPLTVANHALIFLGVLGGLGVQRATRNYLARRDVGLIYVVFNLSLLGLYAFTVVEGRFGLPLLIGLSFFVPAGFRSMIHLLKPSCKSRFRLLVPLSFMLYMALALALSNWLHNLAV